VTVSLVLCHGPSTNCVNSPSAIVENLPAAQKSYDWSVPCDLAPGTEGTDTGYGMLIIVDGTGEFQYSTQFSVLSNPACGGSSSSSASASASSSISGNGGWGSTSSSAAVSTSTPYVPGGWNTTLTTSSSVITSSISSLPVTLATATSALSIGPTSYAVASPSAATASPSTFPGAAPLTKPAGVVGLVLGALAIFAV